MVAERRQEFVMGEVLAESPASGGYWGLGGESWPLAAGRFLQFFNKSNAFLFQ